MRWPVPGCPVLLARDPEVPVLRRAASFDDALELGSACLGGLTAYAVNPLSGDPAGAMLSVTDLAPEKPTDPALIEGVIDARMRRVQRRPGLPRGSWLRHRRRAGLHGRRHG